MKGFRGLPATDATETAPARIGFIGLGIMGAPMAQRLADAGFPLAVWNRTADSARRLQGEDVLVAREPAGVFAAAAIVVMMLATEDAVDSVLRRGSAEFAAMVRDRTLINMGTFAPDYSRRLMEDVQRCGGQYVEAPVSGSRVPAEEGALLALVAGKEEALAAVRPILAPMCRDVVDCGSVPAALVMKLSVNILLIATVTGLAEAFNFAGAHGIDLQLFRSVVDASPMASAVSRMKSEKLASSDFAPQAAISDVLKNVRLIAAQARSTGTAAPLMDQCDALFTETQALGGGALDMVAVIRALSVRCGTRSSHIPDAGQGA